MSGFGGFGSSNNNASWGAPPAPAAPGFGGFAAAAPAPAAPGFGNPQGGGFGSPAPAPGGFGGGGFGAQAPPAAAGFGSPPPTAGFGSGTGFGAPAPTPGFGSSPPAAPGGFGAPTGFGAAPVPAPGGFGAPAQTSGFGAPAPAPGGFGAPSGFGSAPAPASGFGAAPLNTSFGSGSGFGAAPAPSGFGAAPAPAAGGFGSPGFGTSAGFAPSPSAAGFGAAPAASGFGAPSSFATQQAPAPSGFGQTGFGQQPSNNASFSNSGSGPAFGVATPAAVSQPSFPQASTPTFGNSNTANTFGSNAGGGFGSGNTSSFNTSQQQGGGNPFGGASNSNAPTMSFGASSNVMQTAEVSMQDSGGDGGGFGQQAASASGFGGASTSFGQSSGFAAAAPAASGFGSAAPAFGTTPFGQAAATNDDAMGDAARMQSPLPEASMSPTPDHQQQDSAAKLSKKDEELARLKAKLAAKKKKLEERRKNKSTPDNSPPPSPKADRTGPKPPPPTSLKRSSSPKPAAAPEGSLAARNAIRFAAKANSDTKSHLPTDLKTTSKSFLKDSNAESETLDLQNAKSLVGLCQFMCPDDELKRRENEGDIQLLEKVHSDLHPAGWNLRNTAVKRFRRSAADFKLDVPEWIRPPDVLERVCGYLEEWVMERDRQGADPRFNGAAPTPLEVYLFLWDRTRMIRKDFILQNYVGTGGNCDARAVRCHERIARWHTMCEHQLSHIPDFVKMQSQQNIAELGQAMKTLNQFYDDSLRRSVVDVPDKDGKETRNDQKGFSHGCESNITLGIPPVDFDGKPLRNDESTVARRFLGATTLPARGTAEPEMRALYILLTLENEGGMEVLSYAAGLSRERPEIYHSQPVQLALEIFKAKHELNYARFFSILRAPSTPYLFSCLMFKHVEELRKVAIRVMYMTYGYKRKESSAIQDHYPLKSLVRLLCFEDIEEARQTCQHYNITVKEVEMSSSSSPTGKKRLELIYWKATKFRIPKDENKGVLLRCIPRKMVRVIESKLGGATRLAVCRGEASGEGSILSYVPSTTPLAELTPEQLEQMRLQKEKAQAEMMARKQEDEKRLRVEEQRRQKEELKRKLEDKKRQKELARKKAEADKQKQIEMKKQMEIERARKEAEERERLRLEEIARKTAEEEARRKAEAAAEEERRLKAEAAAKRLAEEREAKRRAEEEERERQRQEELKRKRREEERKRKLREEAEAAKRLAEEREKQRLLEEQLEKERAEKRRQAEAAAKRRAEEEARVNKARKQILWKRIRAKLDPVLQQKKSEQSLRRIDPTYTQPGPSLLVHGIDKVDQETDDSQPDDPNELPLCDFLETLAKADPDPSNAISSMLTGVVSKMSIVDRSKHFTEQRVLASPVTLLKLAVVVPEFAGLEAESVHDLIHKWVGNRLDYNHVQKAQSGELEVRFVAVNGNVGGRSIASDIRLLVIPPCTNGMTLTKSEVGSALSCIDESDPPIFALNMDDGCDPDYTQFIEQALSDACVEKVMDVTGDETEHFDDALRLITAEVIGFTTQGLTSVELLSLSQLCSDAVRETVYRLDASTKDSGHVALECTRTSLESVAKELESMHNNFQSSQWSAWPPTEFVANGVVAKYYGAQGDLPISWFHSVQSEAASPLIAKLLAILEGTFTQAFNTLMKSLPSESQALYQTMAMNEQYARCLESAFGELCTSMSFTDEDTLVYIPQGMALDITKGSARMSSPRFVERKEPLFQPISTEGDKSDVYALQVPVFDSYQKSQLDAPDSERDSDHQKDKEDDRPATPKLVHDEVSFIPRIKRAFGGDDDDDQHSKRTRVETPAERKSKAFTAKLEAMLHGEVGFNMKIGDGTLRSMLASAPPILMPESM